MTKLTTKQINTLEEQGGSRWTKYGKDRIYISGMGDALKLKVERYKTGNISSATLDGDKISNARARRFLDALDKAYVDVETGEVSGFGRDEDLEYIIEKIEKIIKK